MKRTVRTLWWRRRVACSLFMGWLFAANVALGRDAGGVGDTFAAGAFALVLSLIWYGVWGVTRSAPLPPLSAPEKSAVYEAVATGEPPADAALVGPARACATRYVLGRVGVVVILPMSVLLVAFLAFVVHRRGGATASQLVWLGLGAVLYVVAVVGLARQSRAAAALLAATEPPTEEAIA